MDEASIPCVMAKCSISFSIATNIILVGPAYAGIKRQQRNISAQLKEKW